MTTIISQLHSLPWTEAFSRNALAKARVYAVEDRIEIHTVDDEMIEAACTGSESYVYRQLISLVKDEQGRFGLRCFCSCPVEINCKHSAAVLFHLQDRADEKSDRDTPVQLSRTLEHWLANIPVATQSVEEASQAASTRLFYKLKATPVSGKWLVEIFKVYQLKSGELRDVKPLFSLSDMLMRQPGYLTELDLRIARLLVGMHSHHAYYSGYPLDGSSGAELLEMLLRTSRLFLDFEALQPLIAGARRSAQFAWAEQASGSFRPQWSSDEASVETVLALEPLYYLDRERQQIGQLFSELDEKLACHLALAPEIPARQAMQFSHRMSVVTQVVPPHKLTERIIDDVLPKAHLTLASGKRYTRWQYEPEHRAALLFTYDGHPAQDRNPEVMVLSGVETQRIQRQPAAEKALRQQLQKYGFKKATRKSSVDHPGERFDLPDDSTWLTFAQSGVPALREAGWQIDVSHNFHFNVQPVELWFAEVEEESGRQWFDLQLGIVVNGERHSLLPIFLHLLRTQPLLLDPAKLAQRGDDELLLVELGAGRFSNKNSGKVALPFGRVKPLMATLSELYLGNHLGDKLRLSAPDAARLSSLEGVSLEWQGGERLRNFARRLRDSSHTQVGAPDGLNAQMRPY